MTVIGRNTMMFEDCMAMVSLHVSVFLSFSPSLAASIWLYVPNGFLSSLSVSCVDLSTCVSLFSPLLTVNNEAAKRQERFLHQPLALWGHMQEKRTYTTLRSVTEPQYIPGACRRFPRCTRQNKIGIECKKSKGAKQRDK